MVLVSDTAYIWWEDFCYLIDCQEADFPRRVQPVQSLKETAAKLFRSKIDEWEFSRWSFHIFMVCMCVGTNYMCMLMGL